MKYSIREFDSIVIGAGGVGLNTIQGAVLSAASTIIAVDVLDNKLSAALKFGATHTINALEKDAVKEVSGLCDGGADYVFVTAGRSDSCSPTSAFAARSSRHCPSAPGFPPAAGRLAADRVAPCTSRVSV